MKPSLLSILLLLPLSAMANPIPSFVPLPASITAADGQFTLSTTTSIVATDALSSEANFLATRLRTSTGLPLPIANSGNGIVLKIDASLKPESYSLTITPTATTITGGDAAGVFYGIQTFLQSLPAAALQSSLVEKITWSAPCLSIQDAPTCSWRGVHLDSARHFQPKPFIKKFIDAIAAQKINRFHWHLVDSEGWRLEIKKYPKLTEVSQSAPAYYPEEIPTNPTSPAKFRYGHLHGGGFYTHEDIKEIVAYAATRHVTIIPEIEFPGHAMAAMIAYPEFSTTRKTPTVRSNISPDLVGIHPEAIQFLKDVLTETMDLFPGPWIHFGGDEAPKGQWQQSAEVQAKIDELGLRINDPKLPHASEDALQAWLFSQMNDHIAKRGRSAAGWEEIMHGNNLDKLPKGTIIMPWLSQKNATASANAGYGVVFTSVGPFYLDSYQVNTPGEPTALYKGPMTAESIHQYNLFPSDLTPEGKKNIFGAQCMLWSELMPRTDDVEYQAFPRLCALAELTWTAPDLRKDPASFMNRLADHGARLTALGLNHRRVSLATTASWSPAFLTAQAASKTPWDITLTKEQITALTSGKKITLTFSYSSGASGLDIQSVELLNNSTPIASDTHTGFTGSKNNANQYTLSLPPNTKPEKLSIRINAAGAGSSDSSGSIKITY